MVEPQLHPLALEELLRLDAREREAMHNALLKLEAAGDRLGYPHSSAVRGATPNLRELRPRQGRSRTRAIYCRIDAALVILAIGPEAQVDPRGFRALCATAERRLAQLREDRHAHD